MTLRTIIKKITPNFALEIRRAIIAYFSKRRFSTMPLIEVFTTIYRENLWGKKGSKRGDYYSGPGSHDDHYVLPYVSAVTKFLDSFPQKPDVVDSGCGDFNIGSKIRAHCAKYYACDVVPELIQDHKVKYHNLDVTFLNLSIIRDQLPDGEIAIVREVLQHLSNNDIQDFLVNIQGKYQYLVISENLSKSEKFSPNKEQITGPFTDRTRLDSGVILTEPPFDLKIKKETEILRIDQDDRDVALVTTVYKL